jgi:hypothetical protein
MRALLLLLLLGSAACAHVDTKRYLVDGVPAAQTGYLIKDPVLPVALLPHYSHTIVDRGWSLTPWDVEIDRYGWRNRDDVAVPDAVMIGDSVVFGYGVAQNENVVTRLSQELGRSVYNAGIPALGPESYAVVLNRFLDMAPQTKLIVIGFYGGNDLIDLDGASWKELAQCKPPASKIYSRAVDPWFPAPVPPWRSAPSPGDWHPDNPADWIAYERVLRQRAVDEGRYAEMLRQVVEQERKDTIRLTEAIEKSPCANDETRVAIRKYLTQISRQHFSSAKKTALKISGQLFSSRCHPTNEALEPLDSFFYNTLFYNAVYLEPMNIAMPEKRPARDRYVNYLGKLVELPEAILIQDLIRNIRQSFAADQIPSDDLQAALAAGLSRAFGLAAPADCDRFDLTLSALLSAKETHGARLAAVNFPSQSQLLAPEGGICERAVQRGIPCLDLTIPIRDESQRIARSLFLEAAHLNEVGSAFAATRIAAWLRDLSAATERNPAP